MIRPPRFLRTPSGAVGATVFVALLVTAFVGPLFAPHDLDKPVGPPGLGPGADYMLGTDYLGRDVLSRLLHGGASVFLYGGAATAMSFGAALVIGMTAGYSRSWLDPVLMRMVDILLAFPSLLILLLLTGGAGSGVLVLLIGVTLVQLPTVARLIRTATLEIAHKGYVEAAVARGDSTASILRRDILPNIANVVLADLSLRFGYSIILIASMNYLGLGLQPPAADWGLMVSENRQFISLNLAGVLAPAILLALVTISVNLMVDAYFKSVGRSSTSSHRWKRRRTKQLSTAAVPSARTVAR
ncbi:ABC transporter permease [Streptomyces phaeochromogenes]|uniref:ABC transporter permease n=1 Tax=Streptomyces phaeochromogenes TaxID=1923 RepID=UPI002DDA5A00|nr:ABC transporter permease [Streptomyces phaeochromogenes]WRZ34621.1 ABC transporter permease [Streptomyces phaeochromogenes]